MFSLLVLTNIMFGLIFKKLLNLDKLLYVSLSQQFSTEQAEQIFDIQDKWKYLGNFLLFIFFLIKTLVVSSVIYIGVFFFYKKQFKFESLWNIILKAELIFLFVPFTKIIWFYFFQTNYTLEDIQYYYPLSALSITGYRGLEPWFIYPFQTLNLFELAYWLILAYYIGKATQTNMDNGLKIVASSYGSALLLWVVTIMFFTLNYS